MNEEQKKYYAEKPRRRVYDFIIGFSVPLLLISLLNNILLQLQQELISINSLYYYISPAIILGLIASLLIMVFIKRPYIRVGIMSFFIITLVLPGTCFIGYYSGSYIGKYTDTSGGNLAGLAEALNGMLIAVSLIGVPLSIFLIRKIYKKIRNQEDAFISHKIAPLSSIGQQDIANQEEEKKDETTNSIN